MSFAKLQVLLKNYLESSKNEQGPAWAPEAVALEVCFLWKHPARSETILRVFSPAAVIQTGQVLEVASARMRPDYPQFTCPLNPGQGTTTVSLACLATSPNFHQPRCAPLLSAPTCSWISLGWPCVQCRDSSAGPACPYPTYSKESSGLVQVSGGIL